MNVFNECKEIILCFNYDAEYRIDSVEEKVTKHDLGNDFKKYVINGEEIPLHRKVPQMACNTTKLKEFMRDAASFLWLRV